MLTTGAVALTGTETAVLTHNTGDGSLSLVTSDYALDGEAWEIKLFKKSTYSTDPAGEGVY